MKKIITAIIGIMIVIGLCVGVIASNNFTFNNETLLKSPNVNLAKNSNEIANSMNINDNNNTSGSNASVDKNSNSKYINNNITNNSNVNNNSSDIGMQQTIKKESPMNEFSQLIKSGGILYGKASNGAKIIIPFSKGSVINGEFVVPEYYVNMPWEEFNDYISINSEGNYIINEFYKGNKTGQFDLRMNGDDLSGIFTHAINNKKSNVNFIYEGLGKPGMLSKKPFYIGVVGDTAVTLSNEFNGNYSEYYHGNKNIFTIKKVSNPQNSNYNIQLNEYYDNKLTGQYFLNDVGNDTYTGIFINIASSVKSTVGLTASDSPFGV